MDWRTANGVYITYEHTYIHMNISKPCTLLHVADSLIQVRIRFAEMHDILYLCFWLDKKVWLRDYRLFLQKLYIYSLAKIKPKYMYLQYSTYMKATNTTNQLFITIYNQFLSMEYWLQKLQIYNVLIFRSFTCCDHLLKYNDVFVIASISW